MPIVDMQRRLREIGRIRMGALVSTATGTRPAKLDTWRLTSHDRVVIEEAAKLYGGTPQLWAAPDGNQWEVTTETDWLSVIVPPSDMAFSQWYELWSKAGCLRRCDGRTNVLADADCQCDPDNRECKTTTRLSVLLPDVPGLGVWRVETHGYYAAVELAGIVELCRQAADAGRMLPARLRLEQRTVKRVSPEGKAETYRFAVPVLDLDAGLRELASAEAGRELGWSPVPPEVPDAPAAALTAQITEPPPPRRPRKDGPPPIPPTELEPMTAAEAATTGQNSGTDHPSAPPAGPQTDAQRLLEARRRAIAEGRPPPSSVAELEAEAPPGEVPTAPMTGPTRRKLFALAAEVWPNVPELSAEANESARRKALLNLAGDLGAPGLTSRTQITQELAGRMIDTMEGGDGSS